MVADRIEKREGRPILIRPHARLNASAPAAASQLLTHTGWMANRVGQLDRSPVDRPYGMEKGIAFFNPGDKSLGYFQPILRVESLAETSR
jgi:hypothetical protein